MAKIGCAFNMQDTHTPTLGIRRCIHLSFDLTTNHHHMQTLTVGCVFHFLHTVQECTAADFLHFVLFHYAAFLKTFFLDLLCVILASDSQYQALSWINKFIRHLELDMAVLFLCPTCTNFRWLSLFACLISPFSEHYVCKEVSSLWPVKETVFIAKVQYALSPHVHWNVSVRMAACTSPATT